MNYNNKKVIIRISKITIFVVVFCLNIFKINTFSLMVEQDPIGIYCIKDNGARAINEWVEIDFEGDGYLEYYYFDRNGYLIANDITPDGYMVNERGQWTHNGVVQRKYNGTNISKQKVDETKDKLDQIEERKIKYKNNSSFNLLLIIIFILVLLFIVIVYKLSKPKYKDGSYYNSNKDIKDNQTKYYDRNTINKNDTTIKRSIWWHFRSDTDKRGEEGEDLVAENLKYIGNEFIVLRNINLPRVNKDPVQIDFLCISKKGIFVIEVKNWLGEITGKYQDEIWHSKIYDIINEQKNPIKQNEWHIDVLKRFIKQSMTYYSIIVFTDRAEIDWLDKEQNKTYITNTSYLNNKIHSIYESSGVKPYNDYKSVAGYLRRFTT